MKKEMIAIAIVAIIALIIFIYPFDADKENAKLVDIIKEYGISMEQGNFINEAHKMDREQLERLKAEITSFKTFFFLPKPEKTVKLAEILENSASFALNSKEVEKAEQTLDFSAEPCDEIGKIKQKLAYEKKAIEDLESLNLKMNEFATKYGEPGKRGELQGILTDLKADFEKRNQTAESLSASCGGLQ